MNHRMQKHISILLCLVLILSLGATSFADGPEAEADGSYTGPTAEELAELELWKQQEEERLRQQEEERLRQEAAARLLAEAEAQQAATTQQTVTPEAPAVPEVPAAPEAQPAAEVSSANVPAATQQTVTPEAPVVPEVPVVPEAQPTAAASSADVPAAAQQTVTPEAPAVPEAQPATAASSADAPAAEPAAEAAQDLSSAGDKSVDQSAGNEEALLLMQSLPAASDASSGDLPVKPKAFAPKSMMLADVLAFEEEMTRNSESVTGGEFGGESEELTVESSDAGSDLGSDADSDAGLDAQPGLTLAAAPGLKAVGPFAVAADGSASDTDSSSSDADGSSAADGSSSAGATSSADASSATDASSSEKKTGSTVVTMDGKELGKSEDVPANIGKQEDEHGIPKTYAWTASDGTLTLTSSDIKELTVKEGDLTIQAAGLNHIGSLVTDSVVNIIGTGILLLDEYDLKDSGEVKLVENTMYKEDTGVTGSVALFLKDKEASAGSSGTTYKLINGTMPGILDEAYTIPAGVNLVLPSGTKLIMNSTVAVEEEAGSYTYYSGDKVPADLDATKISENAAELIFEKGASLTIEKGAVVEMIGTSSVLQPGSVLSPHIDLDSAAALSLLGELKTESGGDLSFNKVPVVRINAENMEALVQQLIANGHAVGTQVGFAELKQAWDDLGLPFPEGSSFAISVKGEGLKQVGEDTLTVPANWSDWKDPMMGVPATGAGLISHQIGATGSGILLNEFLSGEPDPKPGKFPTGTSVTVLKNTPELPDLWRVIVTENKTRGTWTLSVFYGEIQIFDLGVTTVRARFDFRLPDDWDGTDNIYAVFLDELGNLRAFPATYDKAAGQLYFDSNLVGEFVVVQFDYSGELYSKDFYTALAELDEVQHLLELHGR